MDHRICATDMPPQRGGLSVLPAAGTDGAAPNSRRGLIRGTSPVTYPRSEDFRFLIFDFRLARYIIYGNRGRSNTTTQEGQS